jgi:hypothetical protein
MAKRKWSTRWRPPLVALPPPAAPAPKPAPAPASIAPAPPLSPFAHYILERLTHDPPDELEFARTLAHAYYKERAQQFGVHEDL